MSNSIMHIAQPIILLKYSLQGYKELNSPYDACVVASADLTLLECLEVPQLYFWGNWGVW